MYSNGHWKREGTRRPRLLSAVAFLASCFLLVSFAGSARADDPVVEDVPTELPSTLEEGALEDSSCPDFKGCFWEFITYGGSRIEVGTSYAGSWYSLAQFDRSAKNRFGNRRIRIGDFDGSGEIEIVGCIDAGANNSNLPLRADSFRVGALGVTC